MVGFANCAPPFSRTSCPLNVSFLVPDAELAENDLFIGQPVLKHLGIDSKTMLENNRAQLHETDCLNVVRDEDVTSTVGLLLISRMKGVKHEEERNKKDLNQSTAPSAERPRSNYYINKADLDPFPKPALIDLPDKDQNASARAAVEEMLADALAQGFPKARFDDLRKIILARLDVFRTDFSQSAATILPLRLELKAITKPVHVKIRKYSDSQRQLLRKLVVKLLDGLP